jgi:hypothetical protein
MQQLLLLIVNLKGLGGAMKKRLVVEFINAQVCENIWLG